jgi:hypothetical protein
MASFFLHGVPFNPVAEVVLLFEQWRWNPNSCFELQTSIGKSTRRLRDTHKMCIGTACRGLGVLDNNTQLISVSFRLNISHFTVKPEASNILNEGLADN